MLTSPGRLMSRNRSLSSAAATTGEPVLQSVQITSEATGRKLQLTYNKDIAYNTGIATAAGAQLFTMGSGRTVKTVGSPVVAGTSATFTLRAGKPLYSGETVTVSIPADLVRNALDATACSAVNDNATTNNSPYTYEPTCRIVSKWERDEVDSYLAEAKASSVFGVEKVVITVDDGTTTLTSGNITTHAESEVDGAAVYAYTFDLSSLDDGACTLTATATCSVTGGTKAVTKTIYNNSGATLTRPTYYCQATSGNDTTGNGTSGTPYQTAGKCFAVAKTNADATCTIVLDEDGDYNLMSGAGGQTFANTRPARVIRGSGTTKAGVKIVDDGAGVIRKPASGRVHLEDITVDLVNSVSAEDQALYAIAGLAIGCKFAHSTPSPGIPGSNNSWVYTNSKGDLALFDCEIENVLKGLNDLSGARNCTVSNFASDFIMNCTEFVIHSRAINRGMGRVAFTVACTEGNPTVAVSGTTFTCQDDTNGSNGFSLITYDTATTLVAQIDALTGWTATLTTDAIDLVTAANVSNIAAFTAIAAGSTTDIYVRNEDHSDLIQYHSGTYNNVIIDGITSKIFDEGSYPGLSTDLQCFWFDHAGFSANGFHVTNVSDPTFVSGVARSGLHGTVENFMIALCSTPYTDLSLIHNGGAGTDLNPTTCFIGANVFRTMQTENFAAATPVDIDEFYLGDMHWYSASSNISSGDLEGTLTTGNVATEFSDEGYGVYTLTPEAAGNLVAVASNVGDYPDAFGNKRSTSTAIGAQRGPAESGTYSSTDVRAPITSAVSAGTLTAVGAILTFTSDEAGTAYWMVDTNATRTAAQVKSGGGVDSGNQAATATAGQTTSASTGGSASTGYYFHLMIEDAATNQSTVSSTSFTTDVAADVTAPVFASSSPADDATGVAITVNPTITFTEAGTLSFGTTKNFTLYDVTNTVNEEVFSTATDVGSGPGKMSIAGNTVTLEPTSDLTNSVEYAIKWDAGAVKDDSANDVSANTSNTLVSFTTAADVTAPILSSASVGTLTAVGGTLSISTDEGNGTLYWMVDTNATRTAAQVKTGGGVDSGSQAVSTSGAQTGIVSDSGSASTGYYFHAMHEDAATNQSSVSSTSFTTASSALIDDDFTTNTNTYPDWTETSGTKSYNSGSDRLEFVVTDLSGFVGASLQLTTVSSTTYNFTVNITNAATGGVDVQVGTTEGAHNITISSYSGDVGTGVTNDVSGTFTATGTISWIEVRLRGAASAPSNDDFYINSILVEAV